MPLLLVADAADPTLPPGKHPPPETPPPPPAEVLVSAGVPFPPDTLRDIRLLRLRDARGATIPLRAKALAVWPQDGSIRSALIAFRAALPPRELAFYTLDYGAPPRPPESPPRAGPSKRPPALPPVLKPSAPPQHAVIDDALLPNPDGPIAALVPPAWLAASQVSGPQLPAIYNDRFPGFESGIERGLYRMTPAYHSYGVSCAGGHRTYYDGPHALYQRFLRNGDAVRYRRARAEALWFRQHELRFSPDRRLAVHVCEAKSWTPAKPLSWSVLRRMTGQGMLDDYLLTGDPAAKEAVLAMGEAIRQNLPALTGGKEDVLRATERNMAWTLMALASAYALDPRPELLAALHGLMDRTLAWQREGTSGAFEHDLNRADPSECAHGPRGGSPFMTALLVDALMDYHTLTGDPRVREVVERAADWLAERAITSDRRALRYLWGCETDAYDDSGTADLNLLIVPVFGAAYALTRDPRWLAVGDALADVGVEQMRVKQPKQWNQAMRAFGRYLGYRALPGAAAMTGKQSARR
ncbi:beta-L-arabinofuranosidase domain-containing protein [Sorangium cellulosum]|uniref:beta-L-arabinofuranosidase domain-containing protein n=1 Tax=Sorangium cellulosum TaxID=56 RepID=UPI000CF55157|nr:beta-L-arabinofuranosidase domain-containing protein [Sorangium cellulosum]